MQPEQTNRSDNRLKRFGIIQMISKIYASLGVAGGAIMALLVLMFFMSLASPYFLTFGNLINVSRQAAILSLVAVGETIVIISGGIDLSVASNISFSGVLLATLLVNQKWSFLPVVLVVLAFGIILGLVNGLMVSFLKIPPIIATLATSISYGGIALTLTQGYGITLPDASFINQVGRGSIGPVPIPVVIVLVVYTLFYLLMRNTKLGRIAYGIGGNAEAVHLSGISVKKYRMLIFIISGFMASLTGIVLTGRVATGHPLGGNGMEMDSIAATVLGGSSVMGGVGNVWGTLVGVLIIIIINNGLNLLQINPYVQTIVKGVILAVSVGISCVRSDKN